MTQQIQTDKTDKPSSNTRKGINLPLGDNNSGYYFESSEQLQAYIVQEQEAWKFLSDRNIVEEKATRQRLNAIFSLFIQQLNSVVSAWNNSDENGLTTAISNVVELMKAWSFPSSRDPAGRYILQLSETQNSVAAQLWILYIAPRTNNSTTSANFPLAKEYFAFFTQGNSQLGNEHRKNEVYRLIASSHLSTMSLIAGHEQVSVWTESISNLLSEITETKAKAQTSNIEFMNWIDEVKAGVEEEITSSTTTANKLFLKFSRKVIKTEQERLNEAKEIQKKAKAHLKNAEEAYRSKIDLDESVGYWDNKKLEHSTDKSTWLGRLKLAIISTACIPIVSFAAQQTALSTGIIKIEDFILHTMHPSILAISIILISLGSYSIRFFSHQYQSQQHLYLEAVERRTMIKTYLALLSEGRLDGYEDRKVALDTLFRPSQTGIVNDTSAILPTEQLIRIVGANVTPTK